MDAELDRQSVMASRLRGFGPLGMLSWALVLGANLVVAPLGALLVPLWAWLSRTPWRDLGFTRPKHLARDLVLGIAGGAAFKLVMKAVVMPLLGADPVNQRYHFLAGNTAALPGMLLAVILVAGVGEELVYRGFLFERLGKLLGPAPFARAAIVLTTALFFGSLHLREQGLAGAEQAFFTGSAFGLVYLHTRSLWPVMAAHAAFDVTAVLLIYRDLETTVAHWVFG